MKTRKYYAAGELTVRLDRTNAVLVDKGGTYAEHAVHARCPHCGKAHLHNRNTFVCWRVGATQEYECGKCRKRYQTVEICVPAGMKPEELYEEIRKALEAPRICEAGSDEV